MGESEEGDDEKSLWQEREEASGKKAKLRATAKKATKVEEVEEETDENEESKEDQREEEEEEASRKNMSATAKKWWKPKGGRQVAKTSGGSQCVNMGQVCSIFLLRTCCNSLICSTVFGGACRDSR